MIIIITGTPGTGKTTTANFLSSKINCRCIRISEFADEACTGVEGNSKIIDVKKLSKKIKKIIQGDAIIEGHLSHLLGIGDIVIVLRTNPKILKQRLLKQGFKGEKLRENLEAEALDVCLIESLERHSHVYEIDTSEKTPETIVKDVLRILKGETDEYKPGKIDWSEEYFSAGADRSR
ncbi:MAG: adenylate kinase family protein [Euryarchaeota archaeon]|nr:adenylate kinase family protein [Euryarchaeota archaeon]